VEAGDPFRRAGQRHQTAFTREAAVCLLLRVTDPPDALRAGIAAEQTLENPVVFLPEAIQELFVGQGEAFRGHRVAPRLPVIVGRIDERSVEIPENGPQHPVAHCP
jgi:hypothetical protein